MAEDEEPPADNLSLLLIAVMVRKFRYKTMGQKSNTSLCKEGVIKGEVVKKKRTREVIGEEGVVEEGVLRG